MLLFEGGKKEFDKYQVFHLQFLGARCFVPGDIKGGQMSIPATGYASLKPDSGNFAPYILHCKVERAIFKQNTICL